MLLRDEKGAAIEVPPEAVLRFEARDHVLAQTAVKPSDWKMGGLLRAVTMPKEARAGPVRITLSIGANDGEAVGETLVQVGAIKPDQVEVEYPSSPSWSAKVHADKLEVKGSMLARYLFAAQKDQFGAASGLRVESVVRVSAGETPRAGCYGDFVFGRNDDQPISSISSTGVTVTDPHGGANIVVSGIEVPDTPRPLAATIDTTVYDDVGPIGGHSLTLPITDDRGWIGLAKIPSLRPGRDGGHSNLDLDVVRLTADNKPESPHELDVTLTRERDDYNWEMQNGTPQPTRDRKLEPATSVHKTVQSVELKPNGPTVGDCVASEHSAEVFKDVEMGRYVLQVVDKVTGRIASSRIQVGAAQTDADQLEPNIFVLASSKEVYQPGETVELNAQTPFDGPVLFGFARGDMVYWQSGNAKGGVATVRFVPSADWTGKGVYAIATVFRAHDGKASSFGPERAIGAKYFTISGAPVGFQASVERLSPTAFSALARRRHAEIPGVHLGHLRRRLLERQRRAPSRHLGRRLRHRLCRRRRPYRPDRPFVACARSARALLRPEAIEHPDDGHLWSLAADPWRRPPRPARLDQLHLRNHRRDRAGAV